MSGTYREKLLDPRWQRVRLEKLGAAEFRCERCYDDEATLHVHHKRYVKGREPWEYQPFELVVLCKSCHSSEHEFKDLVSDLIAAMPAEGPCCPSDAYGVMAGYLYEQAWNAELPTACAPFSHEDLASFSKGHFLACLNRLGIHWMSYGEMASALIRGEDSNFRNELKELLNKYGLIGSRSDQ